MYTKSQGMTFPTFYRLVMILLNVLDTISFSYWHNHYIQLNSKSYYTDHNGYRFGDGMSGENTEYIISFEHITADGTHFIYEGKNSKQSYYRFVEALCNHSPASFHNYQNAKAAKNRIFSQQQVNSMSTQELHSTRITYGNNPLSIGGSTWYAAANLKISEYIHAADLNIAPEERDYWYIRLVDTGISIPQINTYNATSPDQFTLTVETASPSTKTSTSVKHHSHHLDFMAINLRNMETGALGEKIAICYEKDRLCSAGRPDLAGKIVQVSQKDDWAGYDILSYTPAGKEIYIEVKTTRTSNPGQFFLSENERQTSEKLGQQWMIYRIFKLDANKHSGKLKIYPGPIPKNCPSLTPASWKFSG